MNRHLSNLAFVLAAVLPVALLAACNPEVVSAECTATGVGQGLTPMVV